MMSEPLYYAKGLEVWKAPVKTKTEGGTSISIGFHACTASEVIGEEGAVAIAALLTLGEDAQNGTRNSAVAATSTTRDRFLVAFEKAIAECKLMAAEPTDEQNKLFYRGVAAAVDTLEIFLMREKDATPSPEIHVATLEKEITDLKRELASAKHVAKNAASNCDYWKAQYEALDAKETPTPQPHVEGSK